MRLRLVRGDTRMLGVLAAVAVTLFLAAFLYRLGETLMKRTALLAAVAAATLAMSACSTLDGLSGDQKLSLAQGAGEHIEKCDRDYWANTGLPGSAGFRISCRQPQDPAELAKAVASAVKQAVADGLAAAAATPPAVSPR